MDFINIGSCLSLFHSLLRYLRSSIVSLLFHAFFSFFLSCRDLAFFGSGAKQDTTAVAKEWVDWGIHRISLRKVLDII